MLEIVLDRFRPRPIDAYVISATHARLSPVFTTYRLGIHHHTTDTYQSWHHSENGLPYTIYRIAAGDQIITGLAPGHHELTHRRIQAPVRNAAGWVYYCAGPLEEGVMVRGHVER